MNKHALTVKARHGLDEAWKEVLGQLKRAVADRKHPFREVVISTIRPDGTPNSRTVILRGFSDADGQLMIYTDIRSDKVEEIRHSNRVSMLFYHPSKKLQLKVFGEAEIHHKDAVAESEWEKSGKRGASSYISELQPGREIGRPEEGWQKHPADSRNFAVILIHIHSIEFLQLNGNEHFRSLKRGENLKWIVP
jgi:general stress protein 26